MMMMMMMMMMMIIIIIIIIRSKDVGFKGGIFQDRVKTNR